MPDPQRPRRHRRAVGPAGAPPAEAEPLPEREDRTPTRADDERLSADRPPHHDRGV